MMTMMMVLHNFNIYKVSLNFVVFTLYIDAFKLCKIIHIKILLEYVFRCRFFIVKKILFECVQ